VDFTQYLDSNITMFKFETEAEAKEALKGEQ
jgi:hypothetical protein